MLRSILIAGATGRQGRDLARRYPSLKLVSGNLDNPSAVFNSAPFPIWGVFCVSPAIVSGFNPAREVHQGKLLVEAAVANGVRHFVYSSVDRHRQQSDDNETNVGHFRGKFQVEKYLQQQVALTANNLAPMAYTILRLACFMENFSDDFEGRATATAWKLALRPTKKMQLVSTEDMAFFVEQAFNTPHKYKNESLSLAGDELTFG